MKKTIYTFLLLTICGYAAQAQTSGCIGTATISVNVELCDGIEETWENSGIDLYPNPFKDALYLVLPQQLLHNTCNVFINDISGKQFYQAQTQASTWSIATNHLPKGMYILTVKSKQNVYQKKVFKY